MSMFDFVIWDANPQIFELGNIALRWYGLLFALGFLVSQQILYTIFKREGKPEKDVDTLTVYLVLATIIGARLGHVLFYEPKSYFSDPVSILKIWEGGLASHGAALAILFGLWVYARYQVRFTRTADGDPQRRKRGIFFLRHDRPGQSYLQVLDRIVILVALTGAFIRFGNFFNSEIVGKPTQGALGVFFAHPVTLAIQQAADRVQVEDVAYVRKDSAANSKGYVPIRVLVTYAKGGTSPYLVEQHLQECLNVLNYWTQNGYAHEYIYTGYYKYKYAEDEQGRFAAVIDTYAIPRHPAQLYEAISCVLLFFLLLWMWNKRATALPAGRLFGIFLIVCFGLRFLYEFVKEDQVAFEHTLPLNMGQLLSIPLVILGVVFLLRSYRKPPLTQG